MFNDLFNKTASGRINSRAIFDISAVLLDGRCCTIYGPSGIGKSTFLRGLKNGHTDGEVKGIKFSVIMYGETGQVPNTRMHVHTFLWADVIILIIYRYPRVCQLMSHQLAFQVGNPLRCLLRLLLRLWTSWWLLELKASVQVWTTDLPT